MQNKSNADSRLADWFYHAAAGSLLALAGQSGRIAGMMPVMINVMRRAAQVLVVISLLTACARLALPAPTPAVVPPAASSATPTAEQRPPLIPHPLVNFADCTTCHNPRSSVPIPANHALYTRNECLKCHLTTLTPTPGPTPTPQPMAHPLEGRKACSLCHAPHRLELPADHHDYADEKCVECHKEP